MSTAADVKKKPPLKAIAITAVALVVAAVIAAVVVLFTPLFSVRDYNVTGNDHIPEEQVIEAAGVPEGEILARADVGAAANGVAALPWVSSVTVTRGWPSALNVEISEFDAVAYVNESDGTHLIDSQGTDFAIAEPPAETVEITGAAKDEAAARASAAAIASSISEEVRARVDAIEARDEYNFVVLLDDGRRVTWGAAEDNDNKAIALETVLEREGQEFDISNPSQIAVK